MFLNEKSDREKNASKLEIGAILERRLLSKKQITEIIDSAIKKNKLSNIIGIGLILAGIIFLAMELWSGVSCSLTSEVDFFGAHVKTSLAGLVLVILGVFVFYKENISINAKEQKLKGIN